MCIRDRPQARALLPINHRVFPLGVTVDMGKAQAIEIAAYALGIRLPSSQYLHDELLPVTSAYAWLMKLPRNPACDTGVIQVSLEISSHLTDGHGIHMGKHCPE